MDSVTERPTDRQTDDSIMPTANTEAHNLNRTTRISETNYKFCQHIFYYTYIRKAGNAHFDIQKILADFSPYGAQGGTSPHTLGTASILSPRPTEFLMEDIRPRNQNIIFTDLTRVTV